ncbi:MAG: UDP-2,3-diacylglucosamine diphosphatase LpxI [Candidatus Omnitrophica bacterium]|nr:UDP-2,3-diacylglucosamine diphosphatase LpxI [Candidatus Omnitrophota bacterium]
MEKRIGLIAGNGKFPIIFAQEAKKRGVEIVAIGINEETEKGLSSCVDKIYWLGVGELEKLLQVLLQEKLTQIVMAGQVKHKTLFDKNVKIDSKMQQLLGSVKDKKTDSLIGAVAKKLEDLGLKLLDSTTFLSDYLPDKGVLTKDSIDKRILEDVEFGRDVAKSISGLDIGQTVVVKDKVVLAVESIEGTDETIKRGAYYGKDGAVVVKVSKPNQDMRFDIPVIGPDTIRLLKELKVACIAIEAKKTLLIDKKVTIELADESGIGIVAI